MARMSGGSAIVRSLLKHGVDAVFGLPGIQIYSLFDALYDARPIKVIGARHEQGAAYMAFGYARSTGRVGTYAVVPGPGVLNTTAALCTAYACNAPVLCLTGQIPSAYLGKGRGQLHELPDQLATMRTLTKWATRIEHPADVPRLVAEAFRQMKSGRPGPVELEMCWDTMDMEAEIEMKEGDQADAPIEAIPPDPELIHRAAAVLAGAAKPMIIVGGGALEAGEEILELAETLQAPVVSFRSGRGIVSDDHELALSIMAGHKLWHKTDVLLGIGTRLDVPSRLWRHAPKELKVLRVDIDPVEMRRLKPDVGIVADSKVALRDLIKAVQKRGGVRPSRIEEILEAKARASREIQDLQPQMSYLEVIRAVLPRDGFFVEEVSQVGFASWLGFPIYKPRTYVTCGYQGTLGFGFPTSLGVKVANPDKAVISVAGDGGFMFGVQELATAVQHHIGVVTVLFNNNAFGNVRRDQEERYHGRLIASDLTNPDFMKLAESFGVSAFRTKNPDDLKRALEEALGKGAPCLIEVPVEKGCEPSPWDFIYPKGVNPISKGGQEV
jgi:acetolactate synthase I/II/III large subunit